MSQENKTKKDKISIFNAFYKAIKSFVKNLPVLIGVILLIGLFKIYIPAELISSVFTGNVFQDTFSGSLIGSISAGNPITSYIIGGELLKEGVSLYAVTAFIAAWVTVGIIQLPVEISTLGKRFAFLRNLLSFIFSIIVAIVAVLILGVIP
jgi:uncharacterized membrane protein YraQ (UPF0718 family)